ncbi:copper amine oxidase N-terminal domain-containing protein [Paenibacillus sp. N1-5-1-14]|uniref:copper amine oxidase N-terminal domain-containing protein n=1 Tax=Paenibacillus radicibacter TaxID=2972488 RepID=UPI0021590547|nr:copper amine oxidase N-terminal domain-containing protein [Paenibacillus radicibacter]MCR8645227.1 copper amine oxidase N-terminal domain-containing protein [Paenibacillus radicibacter]
MKRMSIITMLVAVCWMLIGPGISIVLAEEADIIEWDKPKNAIYNHLTSPMLMYKNELFDGGFSLSINGVTPNEADADFVVSQAGELGARGIAKVNGTLEESTSFAAMNQTMTQIELHKVYLIALHNHTFAKIQVHKLTSSAVEFSYVLQKNSSTTPIEQPDNGILKRNMPEGQVTIRVGAKDVDYGWDVYRSDNGQDFAMINNGRLHKPIFDDESAGAGHVYQYYFEVYDSNNEMIGKSDRIEVTVTAPVKPTTEVKMQIDNKVATVNGQSVLLEVPPIIQDTRTLVPFRFLGDAWGAAIEWDQEDLMITYKLDGIVIELWIGKQVALVNGEEVKLDVAPMVIKDRALIPIRFVAENLKQRVKYVKETNEVIIRKW